MDSSGIYGKLKTMVIRQALDMIHDQLFSSVLVPWYSIKPRTILDHIWQNCTDADGVHHKLGAQVYYTTLLNVIQSFYELEEFPIDIVSIFMAHIDPTYAKGFRANYPDHSKVRFCVTINQRRTLNNMLKALIKMETELSNILDIVWVDQRGGNQFLTGSPQTAACPTSFPSIAKRTLNCFSNDPSSRTPNKGKKMECFGCGGPHPWSMRICGGFKVMCPNANQPGVKD
jgi:hypothetical protein